MRLFKFLFSSKKEFAGLSVMLSVILISVIVIFSVGVTTMVVDSSREASNVKQGTTAYYLAEAGLEQALWVHKKLVDDGEEIGANTEGEFEGLNGKFKIIGRAGSELVSATVDGKYIHPLPWTGDVPWHGEGSNPITGGCNPQKPPTDFTKMSQSPTPKLDHPCNWGKIGVGQKVSIPLFGIDENGNQKKISEFTIKLRTPCANGEEYCEGKERMQLNCFDKGSLVLGEKCKDGEMEADKKGEIFMIWQIKMEEESSGDLLMLNPYSKINKSWKTYEEESTSFFEGKLNGALKNTFEMLKTDNNQKGIDLNNQEVKIKDFIDENNLKNPILTLSIISSLIGCEAPTDCQSNNDNSDNNPNREIKYIPYLEYQIILDGALSTAPPASKENIINAEGVAGAFSQNIQVKVPVDNSSLEYVIQQ